MEYLEGQTLAERIAAGPLPLREALRVAVEIAEGLASAHRQGFVHRDLKPGNVMLTKSGAKLLDFGLAKPVSVPTALALVDETAPAAHNVLRATMQGLESLHDVARVARIRGKSVEEIQQEMDR